MMARINLNKNNGVYTTALTSNYIEKGIYEDDKEEMERKIKKAGDLISSVHNTSLALARHVQSLGEATKKADKILNEQIEEHALHDMMVHQHFQREVLMIMKDNEISKLWNARMLEFSWFTKLFRKKYMLAEYNRIQEEVAQNLEQSFKESDRAIKEINERIVKKEKENE